MPERVAVSLGKAINTISHFGAKQSTRFGGPGLTKDCKQNSFCVEMERQTQSTQHVVQMKKISIFTALQFSSTSFADPIIYLSLHFFIKQTVETRWHFISYNNLNVLIDL